MARLIIIGGSLGGLFAANLLSRQGHDVVVLEKAVGSLDGRGAGIVTHPALMDALTEVGIAVDQNIGIQVERRVTLDQQGQCIADLGLKQTLTSWSRVYHLLKEQFPKDRYLHAKSVTHIAQQSHEATVTCEDGSSYTADLIIASDGLRSVVRASLAPVSMPDYAGYVAWRGVCDENTLSQHTLNSLFNHFGFCLPPGEQILGYPVAGEHNNLTVGQRRYNFVWYRPAAQGQELNQLLTDADGRYHGLGIAPLKVSWRHIGQVRQTAQSILAPQFAEIIQKTSHVFFQPIYDVYSDKIAFGRIALMGDASFVARPHVGMGVTKAAQDAIALTRHIQSLGAQPEALLAYQRERLVPGQDIVRHAQYLGRYMQSQQGQDHQKDLQRNAGTVMQETAIAQPA